MLQLKPRQSNSNSFLQYAAMGGQMAAIMLICIFLGRWLDNGNGHRFTLFGSILGVVLAMYTMIKQILKP
ncbi:MAG: AtpZ/AtpI family protein [Bacteroidetes bacterium]|nr:AtpZ/AtpI family protein [Bacteroidota bacterium]